MSYKKFIDSVVGNIARKIEDEFNEKDRLQTETEKAANDASPKKNRLGRNPLEKIDNSDPGDKGVGSIIKKTGK